MDKILVESVEKAEELRTLQSPNRTGIWSRSQQPREKAMSGPRFEQTILEDQVCGVRLCGWRGSWDWDWGSRVDERIESKEQWLTR